MTSDDIAPLPGDEPEPYPCAKCGGSGIRLDALAIDGGLGCTHSRCEICGGSGYGPPPPDLNRERAHCLERLAKWAHRALPTEEF